ncbi:MAG: hypothetical protein HOY75_13275 [Streptomyces sp.]|nr:hypothetical protein [Streptomyces sp.]
MDLRRFPARLSVAGATIPPTELPLGGTVRRRTVIIILSAVVLAIAVAGTVVWLNAESYDDKVAACKKAIAAHDFDADPVEEGGTLPGCEGLKRDDYLALVVAKTLDGMPKGDKDLLDYYDDGSINGSIG